MFLYRFSLEHWACKIFLSDKDRYVCLWHETGGDNELFGGEPALHACFRVTGRKDPIIIPGAFLRGFDVRVESHVAVYSKVIGVGREVL